MPFLFSPLPFRQNPLKKSWKKKLSKSKVEPYSGLIFQDFKRNETLLSRCEMGTKINGEIFAWRREQNFFQLTINLIEISTTVNNVIKWERVLKYSERTFPDPGYYGIIEIKSWTIIFFADGNSNWIEMKFAQCTNISLFLLPWIFYFYPLFVDENKNGD